MMINIIDKINSNSYSLLYLCIIWVMIYCYLKIGANRDNLSKIDRVFLFVFFILIAFPSLNIKKEASLKSETEKRTLSDYKPLFNNGKVNENYGKDFEKWFSDRFFCRDKIISFSHKLHFYLSKYYRTKTHIEAKDGWFFFEDKTKKAQYSLTELEEISQALKYFYQFCDENKIRCYVAVAPRRLEFARDKIYRNVPEDEEDKAYQLFKYLDEDMKKKFIYPIKELKEANKKDAVYFKTDHHWTEYGAYIAYLAIMEKIKQDFPHIQALSEDKFEIYYDKKIKEEGYEKFQFGQECRGIGLDIKSCPLNDDYRYYTAKNEEQIEVIYHNKKTYDKAYYNPQAINKEKAIIIGNSFIENIAPFIASSFQDVIKARSNGPGYNNLYLSTWGKPILSANADIVIIVIESEGSSQLKELLE